MNLVTLFDHFIGTLCNFLNRVHIKELKCLVNLKEDIEKGVE